METLSLTPQAEALDELFALDLLTIAEEERNSRHCKYLRLNPLTANTPPNHLPDDAAIDLFEQWQEVATESAKSDPVESDPTPLQLDCLKLLPQNIHIAEMARRLGVTFWHASYGLSRLERIGLVTRCTNRRYWPTERGFALIGLAPIPAPRHPNGKAGQSIFFKGNPTPPKPKTALPPHITITQNEEGYFININGVTLDVAFDSPDLARRGVDAWLATKPNRKGLAEYFKRKRASLFQFIGEA